MYIAFHEKLERVSNKFLWEPHTVEALAVMEALSYMQDKGLEDDLSISESDCLNVVRLLNLSSMDYSYAVDCIIEGCRSLTMHFDMVYCPSIISIDQRINWLIL